MGDMHDEATDDTDPGCATSDATPAGPARATPTRPRDAGLGLAPMLDKVMFYCPT